MSNLLRRTIHPEVRIEDSKSGVVTYIASDETVDSYGEVIRANGWRFDRFKKNAPFVDSHHYDSLKHLLGKVIDFRMERGRLVETVQWAIDVPENELAQLGWKMTQAGYLKAVSVGFFPTRMVTKWDQDLTGWNAQLTSLGLKEGDGIRAIYLEQQQVELSAVVIPANPNALAEARAAGVLSDRDIEWARGAGLMKSEASKTRFLQQFQTITQRTQSPANPGQDDMKSSVTINAEHELSLRAKTALENITRATNRHQGTTDLTSDFETILRNAATVSRRRAFEVRQRVMNDPLAALAINSMIRRSCGAPLGPDHQAFFRAIGEDSTPGSAYVTEKLGEDLYDILALEGAWATLGVRTVRSKSGKFPVTTAIPNAQFILTEGATIPDDTAMTGGSVSVEVEVCGVLLNVSRQLVDDMGADLVPDFLEKFERAVNKRLDYACFVGDGTADGDNGGMTGLFRDATVPEVVAVAGNTTVQTLDHDDFRSVLEAAPAGVLQRHPAWWMNPTLLMKAIKVQLGDGSSIVKTQLDTGGDTLFSILGFPVHLVAAVPNTNVASTKVAIFGEPGGYTVGVRKEYTLESSGHHRWNNFQVSYRAIARARGKMRSATSFVALTTAAS